MKIKVIRNTGWRGSLGRLNIKANGKKIGRIRQGEREYYPIPQKTVQLKITCFGSRSNVLEVEAGDVIEVKNADWADKVWVMNTVLLIIAMALNSRPLKIAMFATVLAIELSKIFFYEYRIVKKPG